MSQQCDFAIHHRPHVRGGRWVITDCGCKAKYRATWCGRTYLVCERHKNKIVRLCSEAKIEEL